MKQTTALMRLSMAYAKTGKKHRAAYRILSDCILGEHDTIYPAKWHRGQRNLFELRDYTNGCIELLSVAHIQFIYAQTAYKCRNRIILTHIRYY